LRGTKIIRTSSKHLVLLATLFAAPSPSLSWRLSHLRQQGPFSRRFTSSSSSSPPPPPPPPPPQVAEDRRRRLGPKIEQSRPKGRAGSSSKGPLMSQRHLFDAHCHIQLGSKRDEIDRLLGGEEQEDTATLSCGIMSTRPTDWPWVSSLCMRHPGRTVAAYGIHPWWAHHAGEAG
jgi:hypothetical protein